MELTGLQNPMVKAAAELKQKKYRQQQGLFLAEGLRTVEEAVRYGAVQSIFYTAIEDDRTRAVLEEAAAKQIKLVCVSDKVLKKIAVHVSMLHLLKMLNGFVQCMGQTYRVNLSQKVVIIGLI